MATHTDRSAPFMRLRSSQRVELLHKLYRLRVGNVNRTEMRRKRKRRDIPAWEIAHTRFRRRLLGLVSQSEPPRDTRRRRN